MKQCPVCKTTYTDDSLSFCLNDGASLIVPSISSQITQEMNFNSAPTVANNQPIRVNIPQNNPTNFSVPQNTTQTEQKSGSSPVLILTLVVLLIAILGGGVVLAYFAFIKPDDSTPVANTSPNPANTTTLAKTGTSDETQALKDKLDKLEKQLNDQKNAKTSASTPTTTTTTPIQQSSITARVNSPGDGFLALRTSPSAQNGTQITQIPHGSVVNILGCQGYTKIGDKTGRWCRVNYSGQQGWAFDAFLIYESKG